jgi:hypothetical protein
VGNHQKVGYWKGAHVILFGQPAVYEVVFHHGRLLFPGKAATSSEFLLAPGESRAHRLAARLVDGVDDVRGWTTLSLNPRMPNTNLGVIQPCSSPPSREHMERERERGRRLAEADGLFAKCHVLSARVPEAPLAIAIIREDTGTGLAWFPNVKDDRVRWVEALVHDWAEHDRQGFEHVVPWREQVEWMTGNVGEPRHFRGSNKKTTGWPSNWPRLEQTQISSSVRCSPRRVLPSSMR